MDDVVIKNRMVDGLYELTGYVMDLQEHRAMSACMRVANFPYLKTMEDFDFGYQPSIPKEQVVDFKTLSFLEKYENILLIGTPRGGKVL